MALGSKNKISPDFNMSSMTDMVFLLLIFFLLTSNFVTPSGLNINLPTSKAGGKVIPKISVSVKKGRGGEMMYFVNEIGVNYNRLERELRAQLRDREDGVVVLQIDKDVPVQYLVDVAGIAAKLKAKVSIATKPD
ncbi:ExbD/TolR family protein [Rhodoflexus caldus]|uniref:ExbD/TolR family protein n=1 Tax=Rhodoflexus caldus TaxID=2891236 RepID=UPI00202A20AF|nr:biopolymer transporter ExbD [Rhodoflexus caldus]